MDGLIEFNATARSLILCLPIPVSTPLTRDYIYAALDGGFHYAPEWQPPSSWRNKIANISIYAHHLAIIFKRPEYAMEAFATRYGAPVPNTCPKLSLSFAFGSYPTSYPRYIIREARQTIEETYNELASLGPIFRVTRDSVWFWDEDVALEAEADSCCSVRFDGAYQPRALEIRGALPTASHDRTSLIQHFHLFGTVLSWQFHDDGHLTLEYSTVDSAEMALNALHNRCHTFSTPAQHYMINYKPAYPTTFYRSRLLIKELNAKIGGLQSELCSSTSVVNSAAISQDHIIQSMERLFLRADARYEERLREVEELKQQVSMLQSELAEKPSDDVLAILQSLQRNSEALLARSPPPDRPATSTEGQAQESLTHSHFKLKILNINRELQETKERLAQSLFKSADDEEKWKGDAARFDALDREKSAELEELTRANNELTISRDYFYSLVSQYEAEKSSMDGDFAEIEGLRADVKNLKAELEEKSRSLARALQEVDDSQVAADGFRVSLDDMHFQLREYEDTVADARRQTARVEEEKLSLEAAMEEKDSVIKELEQEKDEIIEETSRLTYKVEDQREEMSTLQAIVKETTLECAAKEEKLKEAYTLCNEKEATIATLTKDRTRLATQSESDAAKIEELQNEIDELYRDRRELQADLKKERVERKNSVKLRHELSEKLVALQAAQKKALTDNRTVHSQLESLVHAAERRKKDVVATASVLSGARDSWIMDREFEPEDGGAASVSSPSLRLNTNELMARAHRRAAEQGQAERMRRRPRGRLPPINSIRASDPQDDA